MENNVNRKFMFAIANQMIINFYGIQSSKSIDHKQFASAAFFSIYLAINDCRDFFQEHMTKIEYAEFQEAMKLADLAAETFNQMADEVEKQ